MNSTVQHQSNATFAVIALGAALIATTAFAQQAPPKYSAKIPPSIQTPDTVQTRIGTLKFTDGAPDENTVKLVYDQLDFARGVETFLTGIPAASVYAACVGVNKAGAKRNQDFGITEDLMDARSLFLNSELNDGLRFCLHRSERRANGHGGTSGRARTSGRCLFSLGDGHRSHWP